jgi:5-methylcytosine-specific restriction endonuclease McrA
VKGEIYRRTARVSRDRKFGIDVEIPMGYENLVFDVFGRRCALCGNEVNLVLDHHRPVQEGHPLLHNAVPLCRRCNAQKGIKAPREFYDPWKFAEIAVLLWETKEEFQHRFGEETGP